ncbi:MAG TPA: response regulator [Verrucomicrobiales bacterium]|nr:response regulator [Verrucomicrobiales bacterium]
MPEFQPEPLPEPLPELLTVKETAAYLRIPQPTVYYLLQRRELPAVQIGKRWRIKRRLLDRDILQSDQDSPAPLVLAVDDDPGLQRIFREFLSRSGFGQIVVASGAEAIEENRRQTFDLVFLDLHLPDMGGDQVYAALREQSPDLPIVIITGYPDSEPINRILELGPVLVLRKPLEIEQLLRTVQLLGHRSRR